MRLTLGLGLPPGGQGFNPQILFAGGEQGALFIPSPSTCFTDTARTTKAAVGDAVAGMSDLSGRGNHATQASATLCPILRSGTGGYYLEFDGTDDRLATGSIDFSGGDSVTVWAGVRKLSDTGGVAVSLTSNPDTTAGGFALHPAYDAPYEVSFQSRGSATGVALVNNAALASPLSLVLTGISDISADQCLIRANGAQVGSGAGDQGTGNYANAALNIGRWGAGFYPFNGHIYGIIVRAGSTTSLMIEQTERYLAAKASVTY